MNHARWSVDVINRQKHRMPEAKDTESKAHHIKRKSITELVLQEKRTIKRQSQPSNKRMVLMAD